MSPGKGFGLLYIAGIEPTTYRSDTIALPNELDMSDRGSALPCGHLPFEQAIPHSLARTAAKQCFGLSRVT